MPGSSTASEDVGAGPVVQTVDPSVATDDHHAGEEKSYPLVVQRVTVTCYHEALGNIYFFHFWEDFDDFLDSSAAFNQIVRSTRFLT
jgi:hypothetical protein